jgi:serine/threonine protein kinase
MELENPPKDGNTFFSSGAYGCVHYPRIKCDGTQKSIHRGNRKDGLLSKLVLYDSKSKNEYLTGQKLKATKMLKNNPIVIVERKCEIKSKGVNKIVRGYKKCKKVLSRKKDKTYKYVLFFSKYYKSITAKDYIYNSGKFSVQRLLKYFYFCVYVSNILKNFNIVHNDMHLNNVIFDKKGHFHLIDFGLSLDIDKMYSSVTENKTLNYDHLMGSLVNHDVKWIASSIEHHILNHFVFKRRSLNSQELMSIVNHYYELFEKKRWILNVDDYESYKMEVYDHYHALFINHVSIEKHIITIITKAAHSWDLYRVALSCLNAIEHFKAEVSATNFRVDEFKVMLQKCLHYDYSLRPSPEKVLKTISSFSLV